MKQMLLILLVSAVVFASCRKDVTGPDADEIPQSVKDQIYAAGFGTGNITKVDEGYIVEGDILLTHEWLENNPARLVLRTVSGEQYHTTNLVTGVPRTISVSLSSKLINKPAYLQALQDAVNRFNAVPGFDGITFTVAPAGQGNIKIVEGRFSSNTTLATAGFPNSRGEPYGTIKVNADALNSWVSPEWISFLSHLFSHEIGHCIGFRHTNWYDRNLGCGGSGGANEGAGSVGAIHIPGTPAAPSVDSESWMLACINWPGRPTFSGYDVIALDYLY